MSDQNFTGRRKIGGFLGLQNSLSVLKKKTSALPSSCKNLRVVHGFRIFRYRVDSLRRIARRGLRQLEPAEPGGRGRFQRRWRATERCRSLRPRSELLRFE